MAGPLLNKRSGGGYRRGRWAPMSDINVTPFVDVMLVLLIVFMVTAPLLTVGVPVDLPKATARAITDPGEPLEVTVQQDGKVYIQETEVDIDGLAARLEAITAGQRDKQIHVRGDQSVSYGEIMQVMTRINLAGFTRVALVVEQPETR